MNTAPELFGLRMTSDWLATDHQTRRPPSWPPPKDWVVSEDRSGRILSRWSDPCWDLSPWAGNSLILDFDGDRERQESRAEALDPDNADLLRLIVTWRMWGIRATTNARTLKGDFHLIRRVICLCSRNGILASDLMRFPKVFEQLPSIVARSGHSRTICELHRLWDAREHLGFTIVDADGIKRLVTTKPERQSVQTAYIPPRIWTYQVKRLRTCIEEFLANKSAIDACFNFCLDAYAGNYGSLKVAMLGAHGHLNPFGIKNLRRNSKLKFHGRFRSTAERFAVAELIERWIVVPDTGLDPRHLSAYLSLIQYAGLAYIANFTLQRVTEVGSLRADCLQWEIDEKLGRIPIICGETTKTDSDSDARWPTSPSVEPAVEAMAFVAHLRMKCAAADPVAQPTKEDQSNPYLVGGVFEPWTGNANIPYSMRTHICAYKAIPLRFERLFDAEQMKITEEDFRIARMLTPTLNEHKDFAVGQIWQLAWHQLRRTGAVNMFASGLLSDSSMQFQMKHASRLMPLYYGRGHTKLKLNEEAEALVVESMYETMAHKLQAAIGDRFVSPLGAERKEFVLVNLVSGKDVKTLSSASRRGQAHFREMRIGGCVHRGPCPYGGVESISRCTGGDGNGPCADALYDRHKAPEIERDLELIERQIVLAPVGSPRYNALLAERKGMENYLSVVRN